jgi:hypothetical protein
MPMLHGKTLIGWGVVREYPWDVAGLFETQGEAQAKADALGFGYIVQYGERREDPDSFQASETRVHAAMMSGSIFSPTSASDAPGVRLAAVAASIDERLSRAHRGSRSGTDPFVSGDGHN